MAGLGDIANGFISIYIPTGMVASLMTLFFYKWLPMLIALMRGKSGNGAKPGMSQVCREHADKLAKLEQFKENTTDSLKRIENKVDEIPYKIIDLLRGH